MFEYVDNILCVSASWLYGEGEVMSVSNYCQLLSRNKLKKLTTGGNGRTAWVVYASLPERFKSKIEQNHNPYKEVKTIVFEDYIKPDYDAERFFEQYLLEDEDGTEHLPADRIREYSDNAKILNACHFIATNVVVQRKFGGRKEMWQKMAEIIQQLPSKDYKHKLPSNYRDLKAKTMAFKGIKICKRYPTKGYEGLIHSGFMNKVAAKLTGVSAEWTLTR